ncbi:MAG: helix-turn-helix transcriptional regulator [Litorimonas sp.]
MNVIDPAIRFSAILLLVLIAVLSRRDLLPSRGRAVLPLACLSVAGSLLDYTPGVLDLPREVTLAAGFISSIDLPLLWLFVMSLFDLTPRLHAGHWVVAALYGLPKLGSHLSWNLARPELTPLFALVANVVGLAILVHLVVRLLRDRRDDLLDSRRRSRLRFALAIGLFCVASVLSVYLVPTIWVPSVRAALIGLATLYAFVHLVRMPEDILLFSAVPSPRPAEGEGEDRAQAELIERLQQEMTVGQAYLQQGLTVATLAWRLGTTEAHLRQAISKGLGHDNFSAYVNRYRIDALKLALRDPARAHLPILTLALDHGFNSLSPFNRAFKAQVGVTPSVYRQQG